MKFLIDTEEEVFKEFCSFFNEEEEDADSVADEGACDDIGEIMDAEIHAGECDEQCEGNPEPSVFWKFFGEEG